MIVMLETYNLVNIVMLMICVPLMMFFFITEAKIMPLWRMVLTYATGFFLGGTFAAIWL